MNRREFLKKTVVGLCGIATGTLVSIETAHSVIASIQIQVDVNGVIKNVNVPYGSTVLGALKSAFSYYVTANGTVINGTMGRWRYWVNGITPSAWAGTYLLYGSCTVRFRRI